MSVSSKHLFNRELSWLAFNGRVLEEACETGKPPLERLKFLAISASNLDEFFMVRVGGLVGLRLAGKRSRCPAGLTPKMQLDAIAEETRAAVGRQYACFQDLFYRVLPSAGIALASMERLTPEQKTRVREMFYEDIFPLLTPMILPEKPERGPVSALRNLLVYVAVRIRSKGDEERLAVIPVSTSVPRILHLPAEQGGLALLFTEALVEARVKAWFPKDEIIETTSFRITRNADMALQEDEAPDLIRGMEDVLEARTTGDCIRLELADTASGTMERLLLERLGMRYTQVFRLGGMIDLKALMPVALIDGRDELKVKPWAPQPSPQIDPAVPIFDHLQEKDLLLYHPYDSYAPVVRFVQEAANDSQVLSIKQVLYRTSAASPIIQALKQAAGNGKSVTVLVELKARFDEARNITWARELEQAGVQVIYGVKGLKTHAKICLIIRRETRGMVRYMHFGTGNYNESTARLYGDVSYMTSRPDLGADASLCFNAICGYSQPGGMTKLSMAPFSLRDSLMILIEGETQRAKHGLKAAINAKMNSLVDPLLIEKLYEASAAGVSIHLNVRGICCLRPGMKGVSDNIRVVSVVDRYLEHARIFHFYHGGDDQVFISSADWMPRNLDRRVELMVPVEDPACRDRLIDILRIHMKDPVKGWELTKKGAYRRPKPGGRKRISSQEQLFRQAVRAVEEAEKNRLTALEPHLPADP